MSSQLPSGSYLHRVSLFEDEVSKQGFTPGIAFLVEPTDPFSRYYTSLVQIDNFHLTMQRPLAKFPQ